MLEVHNHKRCQICFELYDEEHVPKFLPCAGHHTACVSCVVNLRLEKNRKIFVKCPWCQTSHTVKSADFIASLQTNFYINDIVQSRTTCYCVKHTNQPVVLFCSICYEVLCARCFLSEHSMCGSSKSPIGPITGGEELHQMVDPERARNLPWIRPLDEVIQDHTKFALSDINKFSEVTRREIQELNRSIGGLEGTKDELEKAATLTFQAIREQLKLTENELLRAISTQFSKENGRLNQNLTSLSRSLSNGITRQRILQNTDGADDPAEIISTLRDHFQGEVVPSSETSFQKSSLIEFDFDAFLSRTVKTLTELPVISSLPHVVSIKRYGAAHPCIRSRLTLRLSSPADDFRVSVHRGQSQTAATLTLKPNLSDSLSYDVSFVPCGEGPVLLRVYSGQHTLGHGCINVPISSNEPVAAYNGNGLILYPRDVKVGANGQIYVASLDAIHLLSTDDEVLQTWTIPVEGPHCKPGTTSLGILENGAGFVCPKVYTSPDDKSYFSNTLVVFEQSTTRTIKNANVHRGLYVATQKELVFVADVEKHIIVIVNVVTGSLIRSMATACASAIMGHLCFGPANGMAFTSTDSVQHAANGYVCNVTGFSEDSMSEGRIVTGLDTPSGVAIDANGNVFVAELRKGCIRVIDSGGKSLGTIPGALASSGNDLSFPMGLCVATNDFLLVADYNNHCVKKYLTSF